MGASSAKRTRWKRYTGVPGLRRMVSASSGVTVPFSRLSHTLRGCRPRARMSSENEDSCAKFFSTRDLTKVPEPWRRASSPSATSPSIALRTVMREIRSSSARSRSAGSASLGPSAPRSMAERRRRCSCWYSGTPLLLSSRPRFRRKRVMVLS
jgi:hypothetical protein